MCTRGRSGKDCGRVKKNKKHLLLFRLSPKHVNEIVPTTARMRLIHTTHTHVALVFYAKLKRHYVMLLVCVVSRSIVNANVHACMRIYIFKFFGIFKLNAAVCTDQKKNEIRDGILTFFLFSIARHGHIRRTADSIVCMFLFSCMVMRHETSFCSHHSIIIS